jgi:hypothetical protein
MKAFIHKLSRVACGGPVLCLLALGLLLPSFSRATDAIWENSGTINTAPQIDALSFFNSGVIEFGSTLPFETSNTRFYTNSGTMISSPGWFFDTASTDNGQRTSADSFVNLNGGVVQALDGGGFFVIGIGGFAGASSTPSYLWVTATNVVNKGTLSVGGNGWLSVVATNVNMARGALEVTALQPTGTFRIGTSNFLNDVGISDVWWGQTNGFGFRSGSIYDGSTATAPSHPVQTLGGGGNVSFPVPQAFAFGYSNATSLGAISLTNADGSVSNAIIATNIIKQAVFVGISDPSIMTVGVRFYPSSTFTNPFQTVSVELALESTNVITQQLDQTSVFFYDTLASETNRGLLDNVGAGGLPPFVPQKPANYDLSRIDDGRFRAGTPGNVTPDAKFLYDPDTFGDTNNFVVGEYAGYNAQVDNLATEPPPTTPGSVTNFPGRVQVFADTLDMRSTRIRGEGEVVVRANHLLSSAGAAVDCENLSYVLGATNGNLNVTGLSKDSVIRMKGNLLAWSGLWSNTMTLVFTNNYTVTNTMDTNGVITGTNAVPSPLTNTISVGLYALVLDGDSLAARLPVITWDLVTHSTNIVISDNVNLVEDLFLDGQSFTLNSTLNLTSTTLQNNRGQSVTTALNDWVGTNAPDLLYFTNNGTLNVPSEGHFGDDRPIPFTDFINAGTVNAGSFTVNSSFFENSGALSASVGPLDFMGGMGLFQNGRTSSGGAINFALSSLKFNNHQITSVGALNFNVASGLSDAGPVSANVFRTQNGFNLLVKPVAGDLLGTTFQDSPPRFVEVDHTWAAADRGTNPAGYKDNTSVGKLILTIQSAAPGQTPFFFFTGTNGQCGLYVDLLDLKSLGTNYQDMIEIDPSLTIYYAAANLGFTPPPNGTGLPQEPEEYLNGQFGGHLVWVSSFAGPNSSVDVVINGVTVAVNRALRFSKIIDSNGNGLPNFYDPFPFDTTPLVLSASVLESNQSSPGGVALSWMAEPQRTYQVEYSTDVLHQSWLPLTQYTHASTTSSKVTIWDNQAPVGAQRFYRIKTTP